MQDTNIKAEPQKDNALWSFGKWAILWMVLYAVVGIWGGLFLSSPKDVPASMTWVNQDVATSSTFYILRNGPHLILEANTHSQRYWMALVIAAAVLFLYGCSQGVQGKLKDGSGGLFPRYGQAMMTVMLGLMVAFMLWLGVVLIMKRETVDLDPATDSVRLDGDYVGSFSQIEDFRAYTSHGSKGGTVHSIVLEFPGQQPIQLAGLNASEDVDQVADYLNSYLTEVRGQRSSP